MPKIKMTYEQAVDWLFKPQENLERDVEMEAAFEAIVGRPAAPEWTAGQVLDIMQEEYENKGWSEDEDAGVFREGAYED